MLILVSLRNKQDFVVIYPKYFANSHTKCILSVAKWQIGVSFPFGWTIFNDRLPKELVNYLKVNLQRL